MWIRFLLGVLALVASLLAACGGGRNATPTGNLADLASARAEAESCEPADPPAAGPFHYRAQAGSCWRSSRVMDAPATAVGLRRRALATTPSRLATPAELFDWAEVAYAEFFPSRRTDLRLSTFTYRYYPESQNHVAVSGGLVYVQGPMSGGELLLVGSVEEYSCRAVPALCAAAVQADCAPQTQWTGADGSICVPDGGQTARIAHGARFTFTDYSAPLVGQSSVQCNNGSLQALDTPRCAAQPVLACNTASLSWTDAGNRCTPNATEPTQIASGSSYTFSDSVQTNGQASFRCDNGTFTPQGTPSCKPAPAISCITADISWSASGNYCVPDSVPTEVADGTSYTFIDTRIGPVGRAVFRCNAGFLVQQDTPTCEPPSIQDSFGGDGGSADGGASGDGTAADGAPIVGGSVRVTDTSGREATATTDARGYWRVRLTGMVPPLLVRVTRPDGLVRHSLSVQPLRTNGYIFIAVTGLTDKIVSDLAGQAELAGAASMTPARLSSLGGSAVTSMVSALRNNAVVRAELVSAGLNPDTFDPLSTPFRADRTGYDRVLDNLVVDLDANGSTVLRSRTCTINEVSWSVGGNACTAGSSSLTIKLNADSTVSLQDSTGSTRGGATFRCERGLVVVQPGATCTLP